MSLPQVGEALTRRAKVRRELGDRARTLVATLGGGSQRILLLAQLARATSINTGSWAEHHLMTAATGALAAALHAEPEAHAAVARTLGAGQGVGVLPAALLAVGRVPPGEGLWWRTWVLDHLEHRLTLPDGSDDAWSPGPVETELSTLQGAGTLLAAWFDASPSEALGWLDARFHALPVRASRQEPRWWATVGRAALLCALMTETHARAAAPAAELLQASLARELTARVPEWEWEAGLGEREVSEWPAAAVRGGASRLTRGQRASVADASRSLWVMVHLLDAEQLEEREAEFGARLEADLLLMRPEVLSAVETRLARLRRWSALALCRDRARQRGQREDQPTPSWGGLYMGTLDELAHCAEHDSTGLVSRLSWRVETAPHSHAHDAFGTYALLVHVLRDITGEPQWSIAAAEVEEWCEKVLETNCAL